MSDSSNRREFLRQLSVSGAALAALGSSAAFAADPVKREGSAKGPTTKLTSKPAAAAPPPKREKPLVIGMIGTSGRGTEVGSSFAVLPNAIVRYVCDVDEAHAAKAAATIGGKQPETPKIVSDLRRVLDDPSVDAVGIATPDHWHAPAALLAMQAGKHVYVEKPCCHNPREGEMLVEAARERKKVVQHGTQRRSWPKVAEGIARVKAGDLGKVLLSRGWYNANRTETGKRTPAKVPAGLDWNLWQGPAPRAEYTENVVHYKWHWYWNWGTGELGNNGIHSLDLCRLGLGVDYPKKVTALGGRYHYADDQETPDTLSVAYDFGDKVIFWEGRSCHPLGFENSGFGVAFYGDKANMFIDGGGYRIVDNKGKEIEKSATGPAGNAEHLANFLDVIEGKGTLNAPIEEGHKSTLLCHLGNIAYRTGRAINCDTKNGHIVGDAEAEKLWGRTYEKGFEAKV